MYQFTELPTEGRKNLKFGYSSQPRGGRQLHEGKIRMTVANATFLGNYLEGRLPAWLVGRVTLEYKGKPHTTLCISTFNSEEMRVFIKGVELTHIWALREEANRLEAEHNERWNPQPFDWETAEMLRIQNAIRTVVEKKDDDDELPF